MLVDDLAHLVGGDVFTLPAIGVAHPVNKLIVLAPEGKAHINNFHQIARVEPGVTRLQHVFQDFFVRCFLTGVTLKGGLAGNLNQQQARLTVRLFHAEPLIITDDFIPGHIIGDDGYRRRGQANRAVLVEHIGKAAIALAGAVKFTDAFNIKALFEGHPDIRSQAIADDGPDRVFPVFICFRMAGQVAKKLSDIHKAGAVMFAYIIPEGAD